jgi:hypothetical protein
VSAGAKFRSFSKLKQFCNHMETLPDRPSKARDDAAALGTLFHSMVQLRIMSGAWDFDAPEPVAGWLRRMAEVWTPPDDVETEVACGIADEPLRYVGVTEPEPHRYAAVDGSTLLTAGRADLVWEANGILHVCDLKSGQSYLGPPDDVRQLRAQGLALWLRGETRPRAVKVGIYYARLGMFDWARLSENPINDWYSSVKNAANRSTEPNPGPHCLSCYSRRECSANPERKAA